jgi:hypothetical protein
LPVLWGEAVLEGLVEAAAVVESTWDVVLLLELVAATIAAKTVTGHVIARLVIGGISAIAAVEAGILRGTAATVLDQSTWGSRKSVNVSAVAVVTLGLHRLSADTAAVTVAAAHPMTGANMMTMVIDVHPNMMTTSARSNAATMISALSNAATMMIALSSAGKMMTALWNAGMMTTALWNAATMMSALWNAVTMMRALSSAETTMTALSNAATMMTALWNVGTMTIVTSYLLNDVMNAWIPWILGIFAFIVLEAFVSALARSWVLGAAQSCLCRAASCCHRLRSFG